jgi:hypothetical protein
MRARRPCLLHLWGALVLLVLQGARVSASSATTKRGAAPTPTSQQQQQQNVEEAPPPRIFAMLARSAVGRALITATILTAECLALYLPPAISKVLQSVGRLVGAVGRRRRRGEKRQPGRAFSGMSYDRYMTGSKKDRRARRRNKRLPESVDKYEFLSSSFRDRHRLGVETKDTLEKKKSGVTSAVADYDDYEAAELDFALPGKRASKGKAGVRRGIELGFDTRVLFGRKRRSIEDDSDFFSDEEEEEEEVEESSICFSEEGDEMGESSVDIDLELDEVEEEEELLESASYDDDNEYSDWQDKETDASEEVEDVAEDGSDESDADWLEDLDEGGDAEENDSFDEPEQPSSLRSTKRKRPLSGILNEDDDEMEALMSRLRGNKGK